MNSPTSFLSTSPHTPGLSTTSSSSPSTPRTAQTTYSTSFTPNTCHSDYDSSLCTPLTRLSFSTPFDLAQPPFPKRRKSSVRPIERPVQDRRPSVLPYVATDPFSSLTLLTPIALGQWSKVFRASASTLASTTSVESETRKLYAVKVPISRSSQAILTHESRVLTHLSLIPGAKEHVIEFHGHDLQHKGPVLEFVALTMEDWIHELSLPSSRGDVRMTRVRHELLPMASDLVKGLQWLHERAGVIHADIKPSNILMRPLAPSSSSATTPRYKPIYIDFTASLLLPTSTLNPRLITPPSLGGGTYDFLAPELLSSSPPLPDTATDVYALGVTLLTAVLGHSPYDGAANVFQRRAMAMLGTPLEFSSAARQDVERCREAGIVRWAGGALRKMGEERWTTGEWVSVLDVAIG
jgi:hypothetical protein